LKLAPGGRLDLDRLDVQSRERKFHQLSRQPVGIKAKVLGVALFVTNNGVHQQPLAIQREHKQARVFCAVIIHKLNLRSRPNKLLHFPPEQILDRDSPL